MNAIILAAGMGKRLKELTRNNTKCMVRVNGVTLIERMLGCLDKLGLSKIVIVIGYKGTELIEHIKTLGVKTRIVYVENPVYDRTNNIYSLMLAKEYLLEDDTLLLESDLIFDDDLLRKLADDPRETLALVAKYQSWMDGTCVRLDENDNITDFISSKNFAFKGLGDCYKTVNIYKFSAHFSRTHYVPFLEAYVMSLGSNEYYEQVLRVITMLDSPEIKAKRLDGERWYEIDDIQDLDIASVIFSDSAEEMTESVHSRYGGYWRFPDIVDFCYLVNPFFPTAKLLDEMKASFDTLVTQYPSGMRVNSLLAANIFGVRQEHIIAGNGAAELIDHLCGRLDGKTGVIFPTFEEYHNRLRRDGKEIAAFTADNSGLSYSAEDIMSFFDGGGLNSLIVINPDNPSGNYIPKSGVIKLCEWTKKKNITLILDESFADFADERCSMIDEAALSEYKNLIAVKSVSKSHGVPGIRLGVLASGDESLISALKDDASIWNINSLGEFYMQIFEKYKLNYAAALDKLRAVRAELFNGLSALPGIRPIPSQANFISAGVSGISSAELTQRLLYEYGILIKDLSAKLGGKQFVRLAVRNGADNARLLEALREILCGR